MLAGWMKVFSNLTQINWLYIWVNYSRNHKWLFDVFLLATLLKYSQVKIQVWLAANYLVMQFDDPPLL